MFRPLSQPLSQIAEDTPGNHCRQEKWPSDNRKRQVDEEQDAYGSRMTDHLEGLCFAKGAAGPFRNGGEDGVDLDENADGKE